MSDEDTKFWIYAGGLPYELTEGDIVCVFSQYGEIFEISLSRDKETGKSRGFCFIKYEDPKSCELAVDNFNGTTIIGRKIKVSYASNINALKAKRPVLVAPQEGGLLPVVEIQKPTSTKRKLNDNSSPSPEPKRRSNKLDDDVKYRDANSPTFSSPPRRYRETDRYQDQDLKLARRNNNDSDHYYDGRRRHDLVRSPPISRYRNRDYARHRARHDDSSSPKLRSSHQSQRSYSSAQDFRVKYPRSRSPDRSHRRSSRSSDLEPESRHHKSRSPTRRNSHSSRSPKTRERSRHGSRSRDTRYRHRRDSSSPKRDPRRDDRHYDESRHRRRHEPSDRHRQSRCSSYRQKDRNYD